MFLKNEIIFKLSSPLQGVFKVHSMIKISGNRIKPWLLKNLRFCCQFFKFFLFCGIFFWWGGGCSWKIYWSICCRVLFFFQFWCWNVDIDPHPVHLLAIIIYTLNINHFPYLPNQHLCMVHQFISICTDIFIHEMISFSSSDGAFLM